MNLVFNIEDVERLYGKRLFIINTPGEASLTSEEKLEVKVMAHPPAREETSSGPETIVIEKQEPREPAIVWKLKSAPPKVIFMIGEKEFSNKPLTELLRKIVVASQVSTEEAGFGIIKGKPIPEDFADMPARFGFFLDDSLNPFGGNPAEYEGKKIWFAKRLGQMAKDDAHKTELWKMMKDFMQLLRDA